MIVKKHSLQLPRRNFSNEESNSRFFKNAVMGSFLLHALIFFVQFPSEPLVSPVKEKLGALKMQFITPSQSYRKQKGANANRDLLAGDHFDGKSQVTQKSKAGSPKKGPLSSPHSGENALGNSVQKGYEFKGKGLKALMGNSSTMSLAMGGHSDDQSSLTKGFGSGNKGNNLTGDYRAPSGLGEGSGHLLGKDAIGNYDRSSATKGLSQKKGIDTAFVQPDTIVMGAIDPEVLRKILGEYLAQFKFCYQQELQEQSEKIKGIVDLNFRIEGDGKVSKISIKSAQTKFSDKAIGCMSSVLRMIDFPHPKGGGLVDIRQPLNFYAESTKI